MGLALAVHTLFAAIWVGGMFFAYVCLRPTLAGIDPKTRTTLWAQVLHRFFGYVFVSAALLLGTGLHMIRGLGGMANAGPHVHIMLTLGLVMMALAAHVWFAPLKRLKLAVKAGDVPEAGRRVGQIRIFVGINLLLGLTVIAIASGGRYFFSSGLGGA
ncbi:CopD family protein [Nevskia sp.]|uniref:CopD family protein n=1 Tax=Nevskia sp. TaxID=1929292 RepID=UPI0025EFF15A|nr:CopD family protein [Nevskia sp.]HET7798116.1 CopD family protein [Nevskia sp.]